MAVEIGEQPATLAATVEALSPRLEELRQLGADRAHVLLVARSSSDHAGVYGRYLLEIHAGPGTSLAAPSLATQYGVRRDLSDTLVVSLSQSGETAEIEETQAWAAGLGARTVAITNVAGSSLAVGADLALPIEAGREEAIPATKSYTAQLVAVAVFASAFGPASRCLLPALECVPDEVARLIDRRHGVDDAVALLSRGGATLVSGRGLVFGTALEVALKLEEACLRRVRGLSYADLRHGPIAVVDGGVTVILVAAAQGPMVAGIAGHAEDLALGLIVPTQLIVEQLGRELDLDSGAPRGLSKTTQTDRV